MRDRIERYWRELAVVTREMSYGLLEQAAEVLLDCQRRGGTIFALGNGGSAATASHFVCDLTKGTRASGQATFRAVALNDNIPLLTAWANDTSYDRVFAEQLVALVRPDDVVLAISASGNSPNVLAAVKAARAIGVTIVALTGRTGGQLRSLADLAICVPSDSIEQVEDAHLVIAHSLCVAMREHLRAAALTSAHQALIRAEQVAALEVGG